MSLFRSSARRQAIIHSKKLFHAFITDKIYTRFMLARHKSTNLWKIHCHRLSNTPPCATTCPCRSYTLLPRRQIRCYQARIRKDLECPSFNAFSHSTRRFCPSIPCTMRRFCPSILAPPRTSTRRCKTSTRHNVRWISPVTAPLLRSGTNG
jgi:hypothetical protein